MSGSRIVGIVGLGSLGEPLLRMCVAAGWPVIGVDRDLGVLARVSRRLAADGHGDYGLASTAAALADADIVVEAVPEDLSVKADVLAAVDSACPEHTVIVTVTTSLSLARLAIVSGRPDRVVNLRFLGPLSCGTAVVPVRSAMSRADAVAALAELVSAIGLTPVTTGSAALRAATTLVHAHLNRAAALVADGYASPADIDTAMRLGVGVPVGPLALIDELGVDTVATALGPRATPALRDRIARGELGRRTGRGFHDYDDLGRRSARQPVDVESGTARPVTTVGVLGGGRVARGIAEVTATAGLPTIVATRSDAIDAVAESLTRAVRRGRLRPSGRAAALARLDHADDVTGLAGCDLVIEATSEDLAVKRRAFADLGATCRAGAVLATTTSSLSVTACTETAGRPGDVLGLHVFAPVPERALVEVVRTDATDDDTIATAKALCRRLDRTPIECRDRTGFLVNCLLFPHLADAVRLLADEDVDTAGVDAALEQGFGYPKGPFAMLDDIGPATVLAALRRLHATFPDADCAPPPLLEQLAALRCDVRGLGVASTYPTRRRPAV